MKKNLINMRNIFFISAVISIIFVIFFLIVGDGNHDIFDIFIGVSTVVVTAFLGIATYYQAKEQSQIDLLDKVPYLRIKYETIDFSKIVYPTINKEECENIKSLAKNGIKPIKMVGVIDVTEKYKDELNYISVGIGKNQVWPLFLVFENASDCVMKKITPYTFSGDYHNKKYCFEKAQNSKFFRYSDSENSSLLAKKIIYEENKNIAVEKSESIEIVFLIKNIINNSDPERTTTCSIALEIETLHGYVYTQYCTFSTTLAASNYYDTCYFAVYGYDIEIKPGPIDKKLLIK